MKITKKNLKQLIAEEYAKIMNEEPAEEAVEEGIADPEAAHAVGSIDSVVMEHGQQLSAIINFLEKQGFKLPGKEYGVNEEQN